MTTKLDHALQHAANGFSVFPLVPNGKEPALSGNWQKHATTDPDKITAWWSTNPDRNIGIAPGRDTAVIDVDVHKGKQGDKKLAFLEMLYDELPETWTVTTASGGQHRYFRTSIDSWNFPARLAEHVDVKRYGGYLVAPGSTIDGNEYTANDAPIAAAPAWVEQFAHERAAKPKGDTQTPLIEETPEARRRATEYLQQLTDVSGTYRIAAKVKDFGVTEDSALALMCEHWRDRLEIDKDDEHIEFRVRNAFRYGQQPPGVASAEAEFADLAVNITPEPPRKRGLYFVPWEDVKPDLSNNYLIDDLLDADSFAVTYGDSNTGKSFITLDQAVHIAAGRQWNGKKVKQGLVAYIASEGGRGFQKRIVAARMHFGFDTLPFALIPCPVDLGSEQARVKPILDVIRAAEAHYNQKCALVVVDTLARSMNGADENSTVDMQRFVDRCEELKRACHAALNIVHHTGKDKAKGARGNSALRAGVDTEIEVGDGRMRVTKQRDQEKAPDRGFRIKGVAIGERDDGKKVTSAIVEWLEVTDFMVAMSAEERKVYDVLAAMTGPGAGSEVRRDLWQERVVSTVLNSVKGKYTASNFANKSAELIRKGLVTVGGDGFVSLGPEQPSPF